MLAARLGNWKKSIKLKRPYNHFDFLEAVDAHEILNYQLLDLLPPPSTEYLKRPATSGFIDPHKRVRAQIGRK